MNNTVKILHVEQRDIEKVLRALEGICERLDRGRHVAPALLTEVVDFISTVADDCHHRKEEKCPFSALEGAGMPREGGAVGVMFLDHEIGRGLVRTMAGAVEDYREGFEPAGRRFSDAARRFAEHLTQHIAKEDNVLFPQDPRDG